METRLKRGLGFDSSFSMKERRMCHATVNTAELANVFEKDLDPMLRTLHVSHNKCPLVRMWKEGRNGGEGTKSFDNITSYITVKHSHHSNMQGQAEGATLLRGRSRTDQMSFSAKDLNGSFTVSYKAKKASEKRAGSLVDTLFDETESMLERAQILQAFYANNDGTGVFALVNDASPNSKSTVTIDTVRGTSILHLLNVGDSIMASTSAERTAGTGQALTVASIDSETQITVSETTASLADNDLLHFSEAYDVAGTTENSKMGVDGLLITSGTLQGLSLTNRAYLKSNVESTAEVISETRVLEYLQKTDARVVDPSAFFINMGDLWWKFISLVRGTMQGDSERANHMFVGGGKGIRMEWFGGQTPVTFDPFCRTGNVYGLDMHQFGYKQLYPLHLVEDGQQLAHRITQKLEYEVAATESGNFYVVDPAANFKLTAKTTA